MLQLNNNYITLEILEDCGFTISKILFKDKNILYFPFDKEIYKKNKDLAGIPFLYPYANRISKEEFILEGKQIQLKDEVIQRDHNQFPIHGFLLKTNQWKILKKTNDFIKGRFDFANHWLEFFPFSHSIEYSIYLNKNQIEFQIEIKDFQEPIPLSFGLHPYFLLYQPKETINLILPAKQWIETNLYLFPVDLKDITLFFSKNNLPYKRENTYFKVFLDSNVSWDDGFTNFFYTNSKALFKIQQKDYELILHFGEGFTTCQIYSPKEKNFICIEPMNSKTNAFLTKEYLLLDRPKIFYFIIEIIT